jgi:hypothetical protein
MTHCGVRSEWFPERVDFAASASLHCRSKLLLVGKTLAEHPRVQSRQDGGRDAYEVPGQILRVRNDAG